MKTLLTSLSLAIAMLTTSHAAELKAGDMAPDFKLKGSDGKIHTLADYKGKQAVVIAWFPKAFTGGCTMECKSMKENGEAIRAFDVAYFTASVDDAEKNKEFAESLELDYPILSDPEKGVARAFGVLNTERGFANRWTFYISKEGKLLAIDKSVKARSHGDDIAKRLAELGIDKH